ncbi:aldo/keto reductase [Micrococcales bacterium 31B]|nr:aldo/keto reductase [Micrococcales bacterium 31B]
MSDYIANPERYDAATYRRAGRSGLRLPPLSLGLWHNFGDSKPLETQRAIVRRAFDLGVTHFDLANNYGPPAGAAEENFGEILRSDFAPYRDEMIITSKAGYYMWPGPYGEWGSRKYLLSSLDQSLARLGVDYVDVFYSHRFDPETPLEETMGALASAVQQGKALYVGVSNYDPQQTREAHRILGDLGVPLALHQPAYSMLRRDPEDGLLETLGELGVGCVVFSPLAQGLLTNRYLDGVPEDSRAATNHFLKAEVAETAKARQLASDLNDIAVARGQSVAQLALAWVLRHTEVTSAIIGASSVAQLDDNVRAADHLELSGEVLTRIESIIAQYQA